MVDLHFEGDLELGADAIDAGDQDRIGVGLGDGEQPAKAADLAEHALGKGLMSEILDALLGTVGAVNVHAGIGVSDAGALLGSLGQASLFSCEKKVRGSTDRILERR